MISILVFLHLFLLPTQQKEIVQNTDFITSDHLGNLYCIDNATVIKYDKQGVKQCEYTNTFLGKIHNVDASDPLRILIHYADFNQVQYLNNSLSQIGDPLDLYEYSPNQTSLICSSGTQGFWIFNTEQMQAFHISSQGQVISQTILLDKVPAKMVEKNGRLYLLIPEEGILVLDSQGQYSKKIPIKEIQNFQVRQKEIFYIKNNKLYKYSPQQKSDPQLFSSLTDYATQYRLEDNVLFTSDGKHIYVHHTTP